MRTLLSRTVVAFGFVFFAAFSLSAAAPQVVVIDAPKGMAQVDGGALATDSLTVLNAGPGSANVSIGQKGTFFSVNPSSFTLAEGQTRVVAIRSVTQNDGVSDGSINILTEGVTQAIPVSIRLFVGYQPAGIVTPVPGAPVSTNGLPSAVHSGAITECDR